MSKNRFTFSSFYNKKVSRQNELLSAEDKKTNDLKIQKQKVKPLLNYPFPIEIEQHILSFLPLKDLYFLLTVNPYWKKEIKTLMHTKYIQKHFSNILMSDAKQIAIHLRKNLEWSLRLAPQHYSGLRALRDHHHTQLISEIEFNEENKSLFINWIKYFHRLNQQPEPATPIKMNHYSMILFLLSLTPLTIASCLATQAAQQPSDIATMQQIYPRIDAYLEKNIVSINDDQDCQPFLNAYNDTDSNMYGVTAF